MASTANRPTPRQLNYLRGLAAKTGTSFTYPHTFAQADAEIKRLKAIKATGFTFAELKAENQARDLHGDPPVTYGTAPADDEIVGYGASATWSQRS
jgi:hypothetical protein